MNQNISKQSAETFLEECSKELQMLSEKLWRVGDYSGCTNVDSIVAGQIAGQLEFLSAQLKGHTTGQTLNITLEEVI